MKIKYFLSILILFLFNIVGVNALETNFEYIEVKGYNNNGNSLTTPSVFGCSLGSCGMEITTVANSYGGAWMIQSPIPLLSNHNYALSLRIRSSNYEITLSSKYQVALGEDLFIAKANYENSNFQNILKSYKFAGNSTLQYYFQSNINASYIVIPFTTKTTTTANFMIDTIVIEDLGTESLTEQEITNITNNQTNIIQNQLNDLNDNINNTIEDGFSVCTGSSNNLLTSNNWTKGYINNNGGVSNSSSNLLSDYIRVNNNNTYTISTNTNFVNIGYALFDSNYNFISRLDNNNSNNVTVKTTTTSYFIRIWFNSNNDSTLNYDKLINNYNAIFSNSVCSNRLDNLNDTQKETNDKLDNLNDNITNSDSSEASGEASDFFSNFNTDTFGLTSVITAPLELIKSVTSKTCTPLQLTLPFVNKQLNLPCLSSIYESYFGSFLTIYRTITFGFISYWVCIKIFNLVKDFKNPEHDEIEVLDL